MKALSLAGQRPCLQNYSHNRHVRFSGLISHEELQSDTLKKLKAKGYQEKDRTPFFQGMGKLIVNLLMIAGTLTCGATAYSGFKGASKGPDFSGYTQKQVDDFYSIENSLGRDAKPSHYIAMVRNTIQRSEAYQKADEAGKTAMNQDIDALYNNWAQLDKIYHSHDNIQSCKAVFGTLGSVLLGVFTLGITGANFSDDENNEVKALVKRLAGSPYRLFHDLHDKQFIYQPLVSYEEEVAFRHKMENISKALEDLRTEINLAVQNQPEIHSEIGKAFGGMPDIETLTRAYFTKGLENALEKNLLPTVPGTRIIQFSIPDMLTHMEDTIREARISGNLLAPLQPEDTEKIAALKKKSTLTSEERNTLNEFQEHWFHAAIANQACIHAVATRQLAAKKAEMDTVISKLPKILKNEPRSLAEESRFLDFCADREKLTHEVEILEKRQQMAYQLFIQVKRALLDWQKQKDVMDGNTLAKILETHLEDFPGSTDTWNDICSTKVDSALSRLKTVNEADEILQKLALQSHMSTGATA